MKSGIFALVVTVLSISALHVYITVNRDNGFMCSHSWTFLGEQDLQSLNPYEMTGSPQHFNIEEDVSGTLKDVRIHHAPGDGHLASTVLISNHSGESYSTMLLMKLIHDDLEYQMQKVIFRSDFSIIDTPNKPIRLNMQPKSDLYLTFLFNYEIFDTKLNKQSLQQVLLTNTEASSPTILAQQELTRVKRTINCIFGNGHSFKPG